MNLILKKHRKYKEDMFMYKEVGIAGTGKFRRLAEYAAENNCVMFVPEGKVERYRNRVIGYGLDPSFINALTLFNLEDCYDTNRKFVIYDMENSIKSLLGEDFVGYSYSLSPEVV